MAIKGYLIYNITQTSGKFKEQLDTWKASFKKKQINLITINNFDAYNTIKNDVDKPKFVFFYDKDIALMYQLLAMNLKLFNNVDAVRLCDDKAYTYAYLLKNKISTPKTLVIPLTFFVDVNKYFKEIKELINKEEITYPLILKERRSSLGLGVYLIHNDEELENKLSEVGNREVIIQEYIDFEKGKDYRVYVINHRSSIAVSRTNVSDFRSNVELGGVMELINNPDDELIKLAMKTSLTLNMDFGAIDIVKDSNNKYYVLEANTNARTMNLDKLSKTSITDQVVSYILNNI